MRHYLIDAYNLIYQDSDLLFSLNSSPKLASEKLFKLLAKFAYHNEKKKFTLIFDGDPFDIHSPFVNVYVEGSGKLKADDIIKSYISNAVNSKDYVIVSSDREILSYAKLYSSDYYLSEQFILELRMFNKSNVIEQELEIYNNIQKDETKPTDLLLKYFNDNPINPDTFEEIIPTLNISPILEEKSDDAKPQIKKKEDERNLSNDELMKLINHFS